MCFRAMLRSTRTPDNTASGQIVVRSRTAEQKIEVMDCPVTGTAGWENGQITGPVTVGGAEVGPLPDHGVAGMV